MRRTTHQNRRASLVDRVDTEHLWALTVMVGILVFLNTHPIRPHDFWWHIAAGRHVATTGQIPARATDTFTAYGTAYPSYKIYWLAETAMYLIYSLGGAPLAVFANTLVIGSAYALTLWGCYRRTRRWRSAAFGTFFAAAMGINDWNVRPQAWVFWLLPLILLVQNIYEVRRKDLLLAVIPVALAIWVNCHGTFPIGIAASGLWFGGHCWQLVAQHRTAAPLGARKLLSRSAASVTAAAVACLANPQGPGVISYLQNLTTNSVVQSLVPEWMPPQFGQFSGTVFLIGLMVTATILALSPRRPTAHELLSFLMFGFLALKTSRGIVWFGLALAPVVADHSSLILRKVGLTVSGHQGRTEVSRILDVALALFIVLAGFVSLPWFKSVLPMPAPKAGLVSGETPVAATRYLLSAGPPGNLFHDVDFGSYLLWAAQPDYPTFVDPRIELYSDEVWNAYIAVSTAAPGWEETLQAHGVRALMLSPARQPWLLDAATRSPSWRRTYADEIATILVHQTELD